MIPRPRRRAVPLLLAVLALVGLLGPAATASALDAPPPSTTTEAPAASAPTTTTLPDASTTTAPPATAPAPTTTAPEPSSSAAATAAAVPAGPPGVDPSVTIRNVDAHGKQILRFATDGNAVDAHDGLIAQFTHDGVTRYYWYGTAKDCGLGWQRTAIVWKVNPTPWCGFAVYSSDDLQVWQPEGFIARGDDPQWAQTCGWASCWRPKVVFDATTQTYVAWANTLQGPSGYSAWTSPTPTGPWTFAGHPDVTTNRGRIGPYSLLNQDESLFVDDDGTGYVVLMDATTYTPVVERLTSDYLGTTGQRAEVPVEGVEAPSMVRNGDRYFMFLGTPNRGFGHTASIYYWADDPLGPWHEGGPLSSDSFGGQPTQAARWQTTDGRTVFVYQVDLWRRRRLPDPFGYPNQGLAGFSLTPLQFSPDGTTPSLPAAPTWTEDLRFIDSGVAPEPLPGSVHEPDPLGDWYYSCDVRQGTSRSFTFTAPSTGNLSALRVNVARSEFPNDEATLELVDTAAPTQVLSTATLPRSGPGWTARAYTWRTDVQVTAGRTYRAVLRSDNTEPDYSCYGFVQEAGGSALGQAAVSFSGGAWRTTGEVVRFSMAITPTPEAGAVGTTEPVRLMDASIAPSYGRLVPVAGRAGVPATGLRAAWMNLTVDRPATDGWVAVYPADGPMSEPLMFRYRAGEVRAFSTLVPVGAAGDVRVTTSAGARVVLDLTGWVTDAPGAATDPGRLMLLPQAVRAVDTRTTSTNPGPGDRLLVPLAAAGVPADATAVLVNVTGAAPTTDTYLAAYPAGATWGGTSTLNLVAGEVARSNRALVGVGAGRAIEVLNQSGRTGVIVDVVGYVRPAATTAGRVVPLSGLAAPPVAGAADGAQRFSVAVGALRPRLGRPQPAGVLLDVDRWGAFDAGFLTAYAAGATRPPTSDLNHPAGPATTHNLAAVPLPGGVDAIDVYANTPGGGRDVTLLGYVTGP